MKNAVILVSTQGGPRVDTRLLAGQLNNQHRPVMALVDKYLAKFERFGKVLFEKAPSIEGSTGQLERYALLNEDQSYFLLSLSRNTDHVVDLKANLVFAFKGSRNGHETVEIEYLPSYHQLHDKVDALAAGSKNKKFVHMNFNKMVNHAVGIGPGERKHLAVPTKSLTVVAQAVAANALAMAKDHHDGYKLAKAAMQVIAPIALQLRGNLPRLT